MGEVNVRRTGYRSLFWPILLIAVGVIWLLGNLGIISGANLAVLFRIWPVLLIVIGLDLLFGRKSPVLGALIGVGAVILIIALMLVGPSVGLGAPDLEVTTTNYSEPVEDATSAQINLDFSLGNTTISALTDSNDLFTADVSHVGGIMFNVEGETSKIIRLAQEDTDFDFFQGFGFLSTIFDPQDDLYWNIGLNAGVPLLLNINSGVGENSFDLSQLQIDTLNIDSGLGNLNLRLPAMETSYPVRINGGAGNVTIDIAENAAPNLNIDAGVGNITIDVPDNAAARISGDTGLGDINISGDFRQVGENMWETPNYTEADQQINIDFSGGVGNLTIE